MFDCYHVQLMEGDLTHKLDDLLPHIGHIQFASVSDRAPPNSGEVNYDHILDVIAPLGYDAPLGALLRLWHDIQRRGTLQPDQSHRPAQSVPWQGSALRLCETRVSAHRYVRTRGTLPVNYPIWGGGSLHDKRRTRHQGDDR